MTIVHTSDSSDKMKRTRQRSSATRAVTSAIHKHTKRRCMNQVKLGYPNSESSSENSEKKEDNEQKQSHDEASQENTETTSSEKKLPQFIIYDFSNKDDPTLPLASHNPFAPGEEVLLEENEVYDSDEELELEQTFTVIDQKMETLEDLIDIGMLYEDPDFRKKKYSVNIEGLHRMIPALKEFQQMVGMDALKKQVVEQVIYLSGKSNHQQFSTQSACTLDEYSNGSSKQSTERSLLETLISGMSKPKTSSKQYRMTESVTEDDNNYDMFHTVIYGPPGVGKTAFAKVLARIFLNLGITQTDTFRIARRSDLIGEYVGHTATKTQKVIDETMGGVLFIDEIYSLGNGGSKGESKSDSFSTECINTLNQNLTEHKGKFICIIAGYKKETEKYFFDLNPGLKRRFSFYYTIDGYDWEELTNILLFKINKLKHWSSHKTLATMLHQKEFIKDKMDHFPHYAGDIETLLLNVKIAHCKRVFGKEEELQRVIAFDDFVEGYSRFVLQKGEDVEKKKKQFELVKHLYT